MLYYSQLNVTADIEWPEAEEALSAEAVRAVEALLTADARARPAAAAVRAMPLFRAVRWDALLAAEPPFVPTLDDIYDTGYFQGHYVYMFIRAANRVVQIWYRRKHNTKYNIIHKPLFDDNKIFLSVVLCTFLLKMLKNYLFQDFIEIVISRKYQENQARNSTKMLAVNI